MDPNERIEELERQVRELTRLVRELAADKRDAAVPEIEDGSIPPRPSAMARERHRQALQQDMRRNVDRVLGGEAGDTLETQIGGIWLSRITVILVMTAIVLGARVTLYSDLFGPFQKLAIVYAASAAALLYGLLARQNGSFFPQTILGAGLAGLYFATYAMFFVEGMQVGAPRPLALPLLIACLLVIVGVAHWRRSQTVAGISLFLVYYTVVAACMGGRSADNIYYALLTCAILAAVAVAFHAAHRWLLFTWVALIATHGTYLYFFLGKPAGLDLPDREYFWLSNGFLTVCYVLFSIACIVDARKTGEYRRGVAPMAGVNSFVYFVLTWIAIRHHYVEQEWLFRLAFAAGLLGFAILAETSGPRRNYLFQIFIAKAVIMVTLALQAYLSGEKLMVAFAVECLALGFSYKRSGTVMFKVLGLGLLIVTFVGCLAHVKTAGGVAIAGVYLPSNWFCGLGAALAFTVVSWFYEKFVRGVHPDARTVSGQWFLADTFLDVRASSMALLHAAAAALILLTLTIIDLGNDPRLPYLLAFEGVIMGLAGFLLRTPQVEVGGVLLLVAAHVCYHAFLAMGIPGFEQQLNYRLYTVLLALFTYAGAFLWERYLHRVESGRPLERHAVAALPYLAGTYLLTTLLSRQFTGLQIPLAQNALGIALLLAGVMTTYPGVRASGVLALGIGAVTAYGGFIISPSRYIEDPQFLPSFILILLSYLIGERLFAVLQRRELPPSKAEDTLRSALVAVSALLGVLGLSLYARPEHLTLNWLVLAIAAVVLGVLFRESRYRWTALLLFAAAIIRAYAFDLRTLSVVYQFLSFAALSAALLIISWAYARYRQTALKKDRDDPPKEIPPHG